MEIENEYLDIIKEALVDYRRWFDSEDESDKAYRSKIDTVLGGLM